ncbi:hypothetical protein HaloA020_34740 [Halomonas sp. A020]|uniref:potassium channel family protein n=1 Tax=Halomonas sp. A020 TaxID=2717374 RepID=UPI002490BF9D|nr:potassium channel family protein [Halomonas sp. A020]BCB62773.1 hypothetical protein HaloA020_34740 [Halomonas sp. A020]
MIGHHWLGIVGILLITLANYDAIKTTLSASHSGPLTNRSISTVWTLLLALHQRHRCHRVLSAAGPWLTVGLMTVWLLLALVGWWLLFCSTEDAVVNATTKAPANDVERLYYAGYTLTTLGYGDFVPGSDTWRLAPPLAAANGFFLFTLTITYMLSIMANVTEKRHVALSIHALGNSPLQILRATHDNGKYTSLVQQLQPLQQAISRLGQQHLAYPILHYYHDPNRQKSLPVALAKLYQALVIARIACPDIDHATRQQLKTGIVTLENFLATLDSAFIDPTPTLPELPSLAEYQRLPGITAAHQDIHQQLATRQQRLLAAYVHKDGWAWPNVWQNESS